VFPNPFQQSTTFSIENADNQSFELQIMDNYGRKIYQSTTDNGQILLTQPLNQGVYYYQVIQGGKRSSGKLLVL
jgi:hypothetical protein